MSDADRVGLAYVEESSYGVFPTGNPTLRDMRFTSESLAYAKNLAKSNEIRSDRQRDALLRLSAQCSGDINFELCSDAFDYFMLKALQTSSWRAEAGILSAQTDVAVSTAAGGKFTSVTTDKFNALSVGDIIVTTGFTNSENNGFFYVASVVTGASPEIGVSSIGTKALVTEAAGASITLQRLSDATNGVTKTSFSLEKSFADVANVFQRFTGLTVDRLSLTADIDSIVTGVMSLMGSNVETGTTTLGDGSNNPAISAAFLAAGATPDPFSVVADLSSVCVGLAGDHAEGKALGWSLNIGNNIRNKLRVGKLTPFEQGSGSIEVTGGVRLYFSGKTVYDAFLADNYFTTMLVLQQDVSSLPGAFIFAMPKCKIVGSPIQVGGSNQDVIADVSFEAVRDSTEGFTIRIARDGILI